MATYTVTIVTPPPPIGFVTWTPVTADQTGAIIPSGPSASARIIAGATFTLTAGTAYRLRYDGSAGGTVYISATADCTDVELVTSHQIDPATLEPVTAVPTVEVDLTVLDTRTTALEHAAPVNLSDGTGRIG